jgi:hypothetical protein
MTRDSLPHTPHREILIKINAWVDEGIAPLVETLNRIDGVLTLESCQGDPEHEAQIDLYYGQFARTSPAQLATFADAIATALIKGGSHRSRVAVEWLGGNMPRILLSMPTEDISLVTSALVPLAYPYGNNRHTHPTDLSGRDHSPMNLGEQDA